MDGYRTTPVPLHSDDMRVLVVDGDPAQLRAVSDALSGSRREVLTAASGNDGLELLSSGGRIDLILCDVGVGREFLAAAKGDSRLCEVPFVMTCSSDQYASVFSCLSAGADDYLVKPLSEHNLENVYANVWLKRKQNAAAANAQRRVAGDTKRFAEMQANVTETIADIAVGFEKVLRSGEIRSEENVKMITDMIARLKGLVSMNEALMSEEKEQIPPSFQEFFASQFGVGIRRHTPVVAVPALKKKVPPPSGVPKLKSLNLGDSLLSINFNSWLIDEKSLVSLANDLFCAAKVQTLFPCKQSEVENFISRAMKAHRPNPFHNFRRACECLQFLVYALDKIPEDRFNGYEKVGLLFAGLLHDVDHPGTNNNFQIRTCSRIALTYNDKSVIQNNTCSIGTNIITESFSIDINDGQNFLLRETFINCVLQTDYSKLQKFLDKIMSHEIDWKIKEDRQSALKVLFLMSDLFFGVRPWDVCKYWYSIFRDEQYIQGDMERRIGLPISPFMDRFQFRPSIHLIKTHFKVIVMAVFQAGIHVFPELRNEIMDSVQTNFNIIEEVEQIDLPN